VSLGRQESPGEIDNSWKRLSSKERGEKLSKKIHSVSRRGETDGYHQTSNTLRKEGVRVEISSSSGKWGRGRLLLCVRGGAALVIVTRKKEETLAY